MLRRELIWFYDLVDGKRRIKNLHWEFAYEGDGFPPGCFEFILHVLNLDRLCQHEDFNFDLLVGEIPEKGAVTMALLRIIDKEHEDVRARGIEVYDVM